ncbi:LysR family transcriptional regulator [Roseovarius aestuariivivens]|uniref:LysR family transcriptional regulator n=1 Tax=Roseovarius aestuariivivens TaxID=1888910 RepID=UPI0010808E32|nr:LysR family transcriptional regulator [Roseovarius aestuariivivens]
MEDLKPIRVFLEVAANLSFAKAAQSLRLTPASVTRIIAQLEVDLGQQLLVRTTRRVSLTSAGAVVQARFRPIVAAFDEAAQDILRDSRPDAGRLRINAALSLGVRLMPRMIEGFRLAYPRIELDVHLTDAFVDIMEETCDLAIRISGPPSDTSTIWRKICRVPRRVVAAPVLFKKTAQPREPSDLDPDILLSYTPDGDREVWDFQRGSQKRSVRAGRRVTSNNGDLLYGIARSGGGVCALPDFIVRDGLDRGDVVELLPDWQIRPLWLTLYYPPYEKLPPLVATFTDFFVTYMEEREGLVFEDEAIRP